MVVHFCHTVHTFCVYPCIKFRLSSILKRLGFYLFFLLFINVVYCFISYYFYPSIWPHIVHNWLYFSLLTLALTSFIEFVCAQSPYFMRGLLSALSFVMIIFSYVPGTLLHHFLTSELENPTSKYHLIILYSIGGGLGVVGLLLYLIMAGRYKMRVRDEEYIPQTHIEAIYDRYLSQAQRSIHFVKYDKLTTMMESAF